MKIVLRILCIIILLFLLKIPAPKFDLVEHASRPMQAPRSPASSSGGTLDAVHGRPNTGRGERAARDYAWMDERPRRSDIGAAGGAHAQPRLAGGRRRRGRRGGL